MLKRDEIERGLEEATRPRWVETGVAALKDIPDAGVWLRVNARGSTEYQRAKAAAAVRFRVSTLPDDRRRRLFASLFPRLGGVVERAWQDVAAGPYRASAWEGTPFRSPQRADVVALQRDQWFAGVLDELGGYDPDPAWLAAWAAHLAPYSSLSHSCRLLSAAIDLGGAAGDEVLDILRESALGRHAVGVMGMHVVRSLLECGRREAWTFIEGMLLAAQRQEGLRQWILEGAMTAHPGAFRLLLGTIAEHDLVRFAAIVRAIDVWFGFAWDSMSTGHASKIVERVIGFLDHPETRAGAIEGDDAETAYLALWCTAHEDAQAATAAATGLLRNASAEKRWVGIHTLGRLRLPMPPEAVLLALADDDLRVAARAVDAMRLEAGVGGGADPGEDGLDEVGETDAIRVALFDRLVALMNRIPGKKQTFKPLVFPWGRSALAAADVGRVLVGACPGDRVDQLIAVIDRLDVYARSEAARQIGGSTNSWDPPPKGKPKKLTPIARATLIALLGDPAQDVRAMAAARLEREPLADDEAARHEALLDRAAGDIRTRALARLLTLSDEGVLGAAGRLLNGSDARARSAAELLGALVAKGRSADAARALASAGASAVSKPGANGAATRKRAGGKSAGPKAALAAVATALMAPAVTADDAFGLATPPPPRPAPTLRAIEPAAPTDAAAACVWSLDALVEANKALELKPMKPGYPDENRLLGGVSSHNQYCPQEDDPAETDRPLPTLAALLEEWLRTRPASTRDADGLELVRAWIMIQDPCDFDRREITSEWLAAVKAASPTGRKGTPKHLYAINLVLAWALRTGTVDAADFLLDQIESAVRRGDLVRAEDTAYPSSKPSKTVGHSAFKWLLLFRECPAAWPRRLDVPTLQRLDGILRAARIADVDPTESDGDSEDGAKTRLTPKKIRRALSLKFDEFTALWEVMHLSDDELLIRLVRGWSGSYGIKHNLTELRDLIGQREPGQRVRWSRGPDLTPRLDAIVEKIRRRVLEIELARGDAETPATPHAVELDPSGGIDAAVPTLAALGTRRLVRGRSYENRAKAASFSTIIRNSRPGPDDTPAAFAAAAKAAGLSDVRLVELALYQPRWAAHVGQAVGWDGLEEGVLWIRSHTRVGHDPYGFDDEVEEWEAKAAELTPIPPDRLGDGAVDRAWFERCHARLGPKRWDVLYEAAKYGSPGAGHTRARLFADTMLGVVSEKDLTARIAGKRHQDAARALGLLALAPGPAGVKQTLARFGVLQEMLRTSRKHGGSMLRDSEKRAVEIGMENLARTAGYPDPLRLQWSMEIEALGDLAAGPVAVTTGGTIVTLAVDDDGAPSLTATKAGKALKSVPAPVKKHATIAPLVERAAALRRQGRRVRLSLEEAMCRGDDFAGSELAALAAHPLLRSMLVRLVMVGGTAAGGSLIGYPDKGNKALRGVDGALEPLRATDRVRIAHPHDLLATGRWHEWQAECFRAERVQPFKQVFRELYIPVGPEAHTPADAGGDRSARYEGQQVIPRQALALLGSRGWVARHDEGVQRTFHRERITAHLEVQEMFDTPGQIDGLTLAGVSFAAAGSRSPVAVRDLPPRLFSEVMRDLDLVVAVAHRGGVDPEASGSTVESRAALLRETCTLLSLANVRVEGPRAIIEGEHGDYALHLGSGTIHMLPGGALWVVPVGSQHRGRLFLPFADDDPKTAEVISKAILLARDREIQDPAILAQIRGL